MSEHDQLQREINRGAEADALMKNPLVKEALDTLEKEIVLAWENTPMRDHEAREKAWMFYVTVRKFRNIFFSFVETGKLASFQLNEKKTFNIFGGR